MSLSGRVCLPNAELLMALLELGYAAGNSKCAQPSQGKPTQALFVLTLQDLTGVQLLLAGTYDLLQKQIMFFL